jgi:polar amino acid transport system ATP-binding protein
MNNNTMPSPVHNEAVPVLQLASVSKRFGSLQVLTDISLEVARGETVCLLGPSGSGKSTLLRCINWLERPDSGRVLLEGRQVGVSSGGVVMGARELAALRTRIGMVFQHFALWPHLSVLQNVMEAPLHVQGRPRDEVRAEAEQLLRRVGLYEKRDVFPARQSGGQKQRVGIARAMAMKPTLLLFDEPTSALDPELVGEVLAVMRDLAREDTTMVVVTHEMAFARDASSRVVFMDRGSVVETASPETFFNAPATERARQFLSRFSGAGA